MQERVVREIRTLRAMWRGLETAYGTATEALPKETGSQRARLCLRSQAPVPDPTFHDDPVQRYVRTK